MPPRARVSRTRLSPTEPDEAPPPPPRSVSAIRKKAAPHAGALSVDTLEQLGARTLAELLMSAARSDTALARSFRLALAGTDGAGKLAAVTQMRRLLDLRAGVLERSDDGGGTLGEMFNQAGAALGWLWCMVEDRDPLALAGEVLALLGADGYGVTDHRLVAASPVLGPGGRGELCRLLQERLAKLPQLRDQDDHAGWRDRFTLCMPLCELADLDEDVDAFIAVAKAGGRVEALSVEIAERLLAHSRPQEALAERHPAAVTPLHRALAEGVPQRASSRQYFYTARDVTACVVLAPFLPEEPGLESHAAFISRLRREHRRRAGFWSLLGDNPGVSAMAQASPRLVH